jgi:hypothetical protein
MKVKCHVPLLNQKQKNRMSKKDIIQGRYDPKGKNSIESRPIAVSPRASGEDNGNSDVVIKGIESRPISTQQTSTGGSQTSGGTQANPAPQPDTTSKPQK